MDLVAKDFIFAIIVIALIITIPIVYDAGESSGQAVKQVLKQEKETPHIEMLAPDKRTTTYNAMQTFNYRLKSVGYPSECSLLLNGFTYNTQEVQPGTLGEFKTLLDEGTYKWRIQCELLNGRTVSSQEWILKVDNYKNFEEGVKITGNIVKQESQPRQPLDTKGFFLTVLAIGALIWTIKFRKDS